MRTVAGSTPWRRNTVSMHCHGVGASANDSTVLPTSWDQEKRAAG